MPRLAIKDFQLGNPVYKGAQVTFYTVVDGAKSAIKATLYEDPTGSTQLANPQKLDSYGKVKQPVYIEVPVIGAVEGLTVPSHDTGIINPAPTFRVHTDAAFQYSFDNEVTWHESGAFIFRDRGAWAGPGTSYKRMDLVTNAGVRYMAKSDHSSTASFAADLASSFWTPLFPSAVTFDSLTVTGNTVLGDAAADSVTINAATITLNNTPTISGNPTFSGNVAIGGTLGVTGALSGSAATFTGNVTVNGNLTAGDASGDTLTVNAGTVTYGADHTATRASGLLATGGSFNSITRRVTWQGAAAGNSFHTAHLFSTNATGANNVSQMFGIGLDTQWSGQAGTTCGVVNGIRSTTFNSAGTATTVNAFTANINLNGAGNITTANFYIAQAPGFTSSGAITTAYGFRSSNLGNALVTNAIGFRADDISSATGTMRGFESNISDGANKFNAYFVGGAPNYFAGPMWFGHNDNIVSQFADARVQIHGLDQNNASMSLSAWVASAGGPAIIMNKSRGAAVGTETVVQNADVLGSIVFEGQDGDQFVQAAFIQALVDGTPGDNDMPTRLRFATTADGASSATERMEIDNKGNVVINTAAIATTATDGFLYVPTCAGAPTGVPTAKAGRAAVVVDSTNHKLYFYDGAWRDAGP